MSEFRKTFESEVMLAYQQNGTKLRSTVRVKNDIVGENTCFIKVGQGTASTKSRNGLIPVMNAGHTPVECELQDYYAGDWIEDLDGLKFNIDERSVVTMAGAYSLGRKTDELIIKELSETKQIIEEDDKGLTKSKILKAIKTLNDNKIPDDGQRWAIVGIHQWNELLSVPEFKDANLVDDNALFNGSEARRWMGIIWILHTGLPVDMNVRKCFIYHKNSIGHAIGNNIKTDISWQGERASHFVSNCMSQGACLINNEGIVTIECDDCSKIKE